jgi:hypothetical protein
MFIGQLLKILFFAVVIYMFYYLVRLLFKAGRVLHDKRTEDGGSSRQNIREERTRVRSRKDTIELDKDQYKVE